MAFDRGAEEAKFEKATAATSSVGSFAAFLDSLVDNQTISRDTAGIIKHALNTHRGTLEPAIRANLKTGEPDEINVGTSNLGPGRVSMRDPAGVVFTNPAALPAGVGVGLHGGGQRIEMGGPGRVEVNAGGQPINPAEPVYVDAATPGTVRTKQATNANPGVVTSTNPANPDPANVFDNATPGGVRAAGQPANPAKPGKPTNP